MKPIAALFVSLLFAAALAGCGTTAAPSAAKTPAAAPPVEDKSKAAEAKVPPPTPEQPVKRERPPAEKSKVAQLFQVPQFSGVRPVEGKHEGAAETPRIELRGFSGKLQAIIAVNGEIVLVEQGDLINGVQVVAIDAEEKSVSFRYGPQQWTDRLFEKPASPGVVLARAAAAAAAEPVVTAQSTSLNGRPGEPLERN